MWLCRIIKLCVINIHIVRHVVVNHKLSRIKKMSKETGLRMELLVTPYLVCDQTSKWGKVDSPRLIVEDQNCNTFWWLNLALFVLVFSNLVISLFCPPNLQCLVSSARSPSQEAGGWSHKLYSHPGYLEASHTDEAAWTNQGLPSNLCPSGKRGTSRPAKHHGCRFARGAGMDNSCLSSFSLSLLDCPMLLSSDSLCLLSTFLHTSVLLHRARHMEVSFCQL